MEGLTRGPAGLWSGLCETAEMIKLQHTVFALPFAIIALITAAGDSWPPLVVWLWVLLAMVAARTAAMSFNRLADQEVDRINPRTAARALPAGRLSRGFVWVVTLVCIGLYVLAAAMLNRLCLVLALPALAVLLGYSFSKRFTHLSHLWLGLALGIAPVGAWIAVTGSIELPALVLGLAVILWVAGFDVIYSLQDEEFDRAHGLHSLPARFGAARALLLARCFHLLAFAAFFVFAYFAGGGWLRWAAVAGAGLLLAWQHRLVRADDLSAVGAAFFTANGVLALLMCVLFLSAKIVAVS